MGAKLLQSCPVLCNPMDYSLPGSSVHGVLQARILEWVPYPLLGDFPNLGIEPRYPTLQVDSLLFQPPGKPLTGLEPLIGILNLWFSFWYTPWFFTGLIYCFILCGAIYFSFTHFSLIFLLRSLASESRFLYYLFQLLKARQDRHSLSQHSVSTY